ncbi:MAG: hypothetical protein RPU34_04290 [Candidatus Sedimenticola sp. (ex Thyasira tokunagai)]
MEQETTGLISKWWLKIIAMLTGLSLPGIALLLRNNLESHLALASSELLAKLLILISAVIGVLVASLILQRPWLRWDEPTGTWLNRFSGLRYCGTCRANKKISVPLKNEITGWRCVACNTFRTDPARKPKQEEPQVKKRRI